MIFENLVDVDALGDLFPEYHVHPVSRVQVGPAWKYPVGADEFSVEMPEGSWVLDVQLQGDLVQMWALVNPVAEQVVRTFITYGTGHPVDSDRLVYIGTFQVGYLVFHLFEKKGDDEV